MENSCWIKPDWPAPKNVRALVTTRQGGVSIEPFDSMNLALHVADNAAHVLENRSLLARKINQDAESFAWLKQVHGTRIIDAGDGLASPDPLEADGVASKIEDQVCTVMTADCLPVLLCDGGEAEKATEVMAVHAGWRGLADGILEEAVQRFDDPENVMAWLGPAIGPRHFEVGGDVLEAFLANRNAQLREKMEACFLPTLKDKYLADLYALARICLSEAGVSFIYGGDFCTYSDTERFYSYRRDGLASGRMASLIWLE